MKRLLLFFTLAAIAAMTGCKDDGAIDIGMQVTKTYYIYLNESPSDITVHVFTPHNSYGISDSLFVIPEGGSRTISLSGRGGYNAAPLSMDFWCSDDDYALISNGENTVVQRRRDLDELYVFENYKIISEEINKYRLTVLYIFRDDFFNSKPKFNS